MSTLEFPSRVGEPLRLRRRPCEFLTKSEVRRSCSLPTTAAQKERKKRQGKGEFKSLSPGGACSHCPENRTGQDRTCTSAHSVHMQSHYSRNDNDNGSDSHGSPGNQTMMYTDATELAVLADARNATSDRDHLLPPDLESTGHLPSEPTANNHDGGAHTAGTKSSAADSQPASAPWFAWAALWIAVLCMSAVAPTFKYLAQLGIPPILSGVWRMQTTLLFLSPPFACEFIALWRKRGQPRPPRQVLHADNDLSLIFCSRYTLGTVVCGLFWSWSLMLWITALTYTTAVRSSLFSSMSPIFLVVYGRLKGVKISRGELLGVLGSLVGIVICALGGIRTDTVDNEEGGAAAPSGPQRSGSEMLIGDALSLCCAVSMVGETLLSSKIREKVPLFCFSWMSNAVALLVMACASLMLEDSMLSDATPDGVFGWVNPRFVGILLVFGFIVGMVGILGFNIAIRYISPLIFALVQLTDPVFTALMSWMAGIEGFPSFWTIVGGFVVLGSTFAVIFYEDRRKRKSAPADSLLAVDPLSNDDAGE